MNYRFQDNRKPLPLRELIHYTFRKWYIYLIAITLFSVVAVGYQFLKKDTYTSYSTILISQDTHNIVNYADMDLSYTLSEDFVHFANSEQVMSLAAQKVSKSTGIKMTAQEVRACVKITNPFTKVIRFQVTTNNPVVSRNLANAMAYITKVQVLDLVKSAIPTTISNGYDEKANSKHFLRSFLYAVLAGIITTTLLIPILYLSNQNVTSTEDVERLLNLHVIAVLPEENDYKSSKRKMRLFTNHEK